MRVFRTSGYPRTEARLSGRIWLTFCDDILAVVHLLQRLFSAGLGLRPIAAWLSPVQTNYVINPERELLGLRHEQPLVDSADFRSHSAFPMMAPLQEIIRVGVEDRREV